MNIKNRVLSDIENMGFSATKRYETYSFYSKRKDRNLVYWYRVSLQDWPFNLSFGITDGENSYKSILLALFFYFVVPIFYFIITLSFLLYTLDYFNMSLIIGLIILMVISVLPTFIIPNIFIPKLIKILYFRSLMEFICLK